MLFIAGVKVLKIMTVGYNAPKTLEFC